MFTNVVGVAPEASQFYILKSSISLSLCRKLYLLSYLRQSHGLNRILDSQKFPKYLGLIH